ncbi:related to Zn-dependent alcohol dehydrogenases [Melanopsichium pennsylvanicum]|uniref:Related to Zn-dependent alcohol dehydrogenases n=2 Tax=Melanopsichium pennsylvanicum TaxID=63383 RepID=A0AAJ4XMG8_9BASI|nr:related to Zn-dependent alcohol dehydrogenases [Melanopsichium pennsylvanicum 4]SNX84491.1 related to Zn-dependent alcohol dehydrogenases [Melanopsichium pennsylvanicum]
MADSSTSAPNLPKTMKALRIEEFNADPPYVMRHDVPVPSVGPNDVLIRIATAGYCHTELMVARGDFASKSRHPLPLIPSHEPTGVVVALGSNATSNPAGGKLASSGSEPLKLGDRVGCITFRDYCGKCAECKRASPKYCADQDMVGVTADGAFAEYMRADYRSCVLLPNDLDFDSAAPLFCAGATIYTAIIGCKLEKGQTLAIVGAGALGHLGVQLAKCLGYNVWLFDARDAPLEMCKKLPYPPDKIFNSGKIDGHDQEAVEKLVNEQLGGERADAVIMATDVIPAYEFGLAITKNHGLFMVVGQPNDPIPIHYNHLIFRDITVKGSLLGDPKTTREVCDLVAKHGIEVNTIAYRLDEVEKMREDYGRPTHQGKMIVSVNADL